MKTILLVLGVTVVSLSCNPFSPKLENLPETQINLLGNRNTLDGLFQFFKTAYELKDTSMYGKMFDESFVFSYFDFQNSVQINWDRAQEMNTTYRLFRNTEQITLDWNYYLQKDSSASEASVVRSFNLTIVESSQQIYTGTGRARFRLIKLNPDDPWKFTYWFDDSDF